MTRRRIAIAVAVVVLALGGYVAMAAPPGPRSMRDFDPHRLAQLELRMWQAYYAKQNVRLLGLLVSMLREQYRYSWATASRQGFHLARAASTFGDARDHYEQVLPDLEAAYTIARDWLNREARNGFDPAAVARAELAWWVARRTPGQNDPERVGGLIADEYALLYRVPHQAVLPAGIARARAGQLRDLQARAPDWNIIGSMLDESYVRLHNAVAR
jgi:hypothetical protein